MPDDDRVQEALAEYLEHLEIGGPEPEFPHLTEDERRELQELLEALELTDGIAFGASGSQAGAAPEAATAEGRRLVAELRDVLPPGARLDVDDDGLVPRLGDVAVAERFVIGTFGGRVRVWLLDVDRVDEIESDPGVLGDLGRVFRMLADTAAVALVGRDLSCVVVEPEDTGPRIHVPSGSLVPRRYQRAVAAAPEAVAVFLDELVPYWDPMPAFDHDRGVRIDVVEVAAGPVRAAVERQRGIGERARKGNPKKDALSAFGDSEVRSVDALVRDLFDGSIGPDHVEARIERIARR